MSLSLRIIILILISIVINTALIIFLSLNQQKNLNETFEKKFVSSTVQLLSDSLIRDIIENNVLKTNNVLKVVKNNNEIIEFIYVTDTNNNIFAYSFEDGFPKYLIDSRQIETNDNNINLINRFQTDSGLIYEYKKNLITGLDISIYIGINRSSFVTILKENINNILFGSISLALILLLISLYISKKTINPLMQLTQLLKNHKDDEKIDFSIIDKSTIEINQLILTLKTAINSVIEKEKNLSTTLNSIGDAVIVTDANGNIVRMNPVAERLTGYSSAEAQMKSMPTIFKIIDATTREKMFDPAKKVLSDGKVIFIHNHTTLISKNKTECQIADSAAPIVDKKGDITGVIVVFHDVTQQYRLRERSKSALEQLERIFKGITTQIIILELDGTIVISNNVLDLFIDNNVNEIVGKVIWNLANIMQENYLHMTIKELVARTSRGQHVQKDIKYKTKWISMNLHPVKNKDGDIIQIVLEATDITIRKEAEEKILYQANYDSLTGIANRSLALAQLSQTIKESNRNKYSVAVLFLDLDNFKNINDNLGHDSGDKVLIQVAKRLKEVLRDKDTIGRLGGDEFIIVLNDITEPFDAQVVCNNLIRNFERPFIIDGLEILVTVSIGIVIYPIDGKDVSELLINSDIAMYNAKNNGKNTYSFFTKEMNENITRQLLIEGKMYKALVLNEFEVYYQPKVDIKTLKVVGLEALLRWNNSELGFISPEEFIPIAEKSAHIIKIGYFVIDEVTKDLSKLKDHIDDDFRVSINLSPIQFRDSSLIGKIDSSFKKYNVSAYNIDFEITENAFIYQEMKIKQKLKELKKLGVTISMDDFGTGYASLGYLREYPFDLIKIDKSFVMNMINSEKDKDLVIAMVAMAKSLKLKVVAEGVETEDILALLKEIDCDFAQGYLFSKPVPFSEIFKSILK